MRFWTADTHFSKTSDEVVFRDFRPFLHVSEMNDEIIKIWNSQASSGDVIYHLGDFVNFNYTDNIHYDECFELVKKINADVILICGNNETRLIESKFNGDFKKFKKHLVDIGFKDVVLDGLEIVIDGKPVYLTHYPSKHRKGMENLFGHIHSSGFVKKYGFNVGIDNHYLGLFSENEIIDLFSRRRFYDQDVYD